MTLIEVTLVIATLLALLSALFAGSHGWRRGGDRASCVLILRNMQMAARSYQNLNGYDYGSRPAMAYGTRDIARHLHEQGFITPHSYNQASGAAPCPAGGAYICPTPDTFPPPGQLYMICSLAGSDAHEPEFHSDW